MADNFTHASLFALLITASSILMLYTESSSGVGTSVSFKTACENKSPWIVYWLQSSKNISSKQHNPCIFSATIVCIISSGKSFFRYDAVDLPSRKTSHKRNALSKYFLTGIGMFQMRSFINPLSPYTGWCTRCC